MKQTPIHNSAKMATMQSQIGFTIIELMVTLVILAILASMTMPLLKLTLQRNKEATLAQNLMQLRVAIDAYKQAVDEGRITQDNDQSGYPPNLEVLVNGVEDSKDAKKRKIKFLRSIPKDPMRNPNDSSPFKHDWGLRSYNTEADKPQYNDDVYDVYSLSPLKSIRGEPYAAW